MPGLRRSTRRSPTKAQQSGQHAGLNPMRAGVWAHHPLHTCMLRGWPEADLASLIQEQAFQSNPARAAQSLTSKRASADTTTPVAHILSHVAVSAYKVNDPTQIKYQDLIKRVILK